MNRYIVILLLTGLFSLGAQAKSMVEIWNAMPDSILPYIDRNHRLEMTEFIGMGLKGDVDNSLQGKSEMDTITADYIHLTLNENTVMQLKKLPYAHGDSIVCVVTTWSAPEGESQVRFFSQDWQPVSLGQPLTQHRLDSLAGKMLVRPDTMSADRFDQLREKINFTMVKASLFEDSNDLELSLSVPLLSEDDKKDIQSILRLMNLKWTGENYNI